MRHGISTLLVLLYQTTDITYYDGKISLLICILLAGLRTILPKRISEKIFRLNYSLKKFFYGNINLKCYISNINK